MNLLNKLFAETNSPEGIPKRVSARVLLNEAGKVQDVRIKQGSGNPAIDRQAISELKNACYAPCRLGSKAVRIWYDVVWTSHNQP